MPEGFRDAIAADKFVLECQMIPEAGALEQIISEEHDLIMLGANSVDDGLAKMAERVKELLKKIKKKLARELIKSSEFRFRGLS